MAFERDDLRSVLASIKPDSAYFEVILAVARERRGRLGRAALRAAIQAAQADAEVHWAANPLVRADYLCFTPLGAFRAGLKLTQDGLKWVLRGESDAPVKPNRAAKDLAKDPNVFYWAIDKGYSVVDRVIGLDEWTEGGFIYFVKIIGVCNPLPLPQTPYHVDQCPMHPGRRPGKQEYCLYCENSDGIPGSGPRRPNAVRVPR